MNFLSSKVIWYTFLAILAYLVLTRWRGANTLLGTGFSGYARAVRVLQGR
ncbi:MAG: hypothetical protein IT352_15420 [Gemmatimonadales bacterium]|nr:hypothetical protein [Gemmatimonadales bacterium]